MVDFFGKRLTHDDVVKELQKYDYEYPDTNQYDDWLEKETYKFVLEHNGRLYPPKHILSRITGISTSEFSGGDRTNSVFEKLGFIVRDKKEESGKSAEIGRETNALIESASLLLRKKKQVILYGPPGTGKTFNTKRIALALIKDV